MDIRKIEYFIRLAEILNFSKAAEQLHISHQALSRQMQQLEEELGAKLFERTTAKVSLTEVGKKAYDIFVPILEQLNQGYARLQEFVRYKKGTLRVGYFSTLSYSRIIEPMIQFFKQQSPVIQVDVLATDVGLERQLLEQDTIDFAVSIMFEEDDWKEYSYRILRKEPLRIIVSDHHPWYQKQFITAEDMRTGRMLVYENRPADGKKAFFPEVEVKERMQVRNADSYMNMLRQGTYFGIIGENYSRREGKFKLFPLPNTLKMEVPVIAVCKKIHPAANILDQICKIYQ